MEEKEWSAESLREYTWVKTRLKDPHGVVIETGKYGLEVKILSLDEVLTRIETADTKPTREFRNVPQEIGDLMEAAGIASIYALSKATRRLSGENKLEVLSDWFNGGRLPCTEKEKPRLYLGHPSIFDAFVQWVISYLALHRDIDGRVGRDQEEMVNAARKIKGLPDVRRYS